MQRLKEFIYHLPKTILAIACFLILGVMFLIFSAVDWLLNGKLNKEKEDLRLVRFGGSLTKKA